MDSTSDIEREKLTNDLQRLGFTLTDSRVYLSLIVLGPSNPVKIAEDSKVDRSRVYDSLKRLSKKGYIEEEPVKRGPMYKAKPPGDILSALRKDYREKITLSTALEKTLHSYQNPAKDPFLVSLNGKDPIFKGILSLIENAEKYIQFIITPDLSENRDSFKTISDYLVKTKREKPNVKIEIALNLKVEEYQFMLIKLHEQDIAIYKWDIGNVLPFGLYLSEKTYIFTTLSIGEVPGYNTGITIENAVPEMMAGFKHLFEWNYISYYKKGKMKKLKKPPIEQELDNEKSNESELEK